MRVSVGTAPAFLPMNARVQKLEAPYKPGRDLGTRAYIDDDEND